jgi:signal transduction histidine kinase
MGETVGALLAWARLEAGTEPSAATELRLDQLVEDVAAELDPGGRIELETEPVVVTADPTLIRIAVRNIVDNALRHGSDREESVTVTVAAAGTVAVRDRGRGFAAGALGRDGVTRFRSGSPEGTGLGLSIASRIAELHGGRLTARDLDGGGTELTIALGPPGAAA